MSDCTRRELLAGAAARLIAGARPLSALVQTTAQTGSDFPLEDYHVHLNIGNSFFYRTDIAASQDFLEEILEMYGD